MSIPSPEQCPGSLTCPVQEAVKGGALPPKAVCSICRAVLDLGYGGRLPVHERPARAGVPSPELPEF
jgi:hypothetical protein